MKKYLLSIGVVLSVWAPIATIISCGNNNNKNINPNAASTKTKSKSTSFKLEDGKYNVYKNNLVRNAKTYGLKNYRNASITLSEEINEKEVSIRRETGEAFAPHFRPADIPDWNKENEVDGNYTRSRTPLANRKTVLEKVTNKKGSGRFYSVNTLRNGTSNSLNRTSIKGSSNAQIIQGLQYMTDMIAFGGSVGEGEVYIPRAQDIDAYHRMGVKVHACIFFAPRAFGGSPQDYEDLMGADLNKSADNLVAMAKYYGFDGWFINDENRPRETWTKFMKIFHKKAKTAGIEISYYANKADQNKNSVYSAGTKAYDIWFNDYYRTQAISSGITEETSPIGFQTGASWPTISAANGKTFWTYREWENGTYYKDELHVKAFFNGNLENWQNISVVNDPRQAKKNGMAYHYKEYTPFVEHKSFATSFNKGEGKFYNVKGKVIENSNMKDGYANMALQDYLPTWKYIIDVIEKDGTINTSKIGKTGISIENIETKNAWVGSDALVYKGNINKGEIITNKLFASEITLQDKDYFSMMYKGSTIPSMAVWTKEGKEFKRHLIDGIVSMKNFENNYKQIIFDVSSLKGELVSSFGIAFKNKKQSTATLKFTLGKLAFNVSGEGTKDNIKINNIVNDGEWLTSSGKNIRLRWDTPSKNIKEYLIYSTDKEFKSRKLIDISNSPAVVLKGLKMKKITNIIIVPINNLRETLSEIKVSIKGEKLDFSDDSKWSHKKPSKTNKYGIKTGHGFVDKIPDGEGGVYLINDQVSVMHFTNAGILETNGNYAREIFGGKSDDYESKYHKGNGVTYGSSFVGKNGDIFISERAGRNGLFVFSKGMGKANLKWNKYQENNSIFTGRDEYITTMFERKGESLILVSSLGNLAIIDKNWNLTMQKNKNVIGTNNTKEVEASSCSFGDFVLVSSWDLNGTFVKSVLIDKDNKISDSTLEIGRVLSKKKVGNKWVIVSVKTTKIDRSNNLLLTIFNLETNKVEFTKEVSTPKGLLKISKKYLNTVILSNDSKKVFMRDEDEEAIARPYQKGYGEQSAYIMCLDISNMTKKNGVVAKAKSLKTIHAEEYGVKYAGDYVNMFMLKNGNIAYSTSDWGRVGMIKIGRGKTTDEFHEAVLGSVYKIDYRFKTSNGKKIDIISLNTFFKEADNPFLPINPFKK